MPPASQISATRPARILIYGKGKTKKTWWTCDAVRAGYNVILLDGDDGSHIVRQMGLSQPELERLEVLDVVNAPGNPAFARFMAMLSRTETPFTWQVEEKRRYIGAPKPGMSYVDIDVRKLPSDAVLVFDSWTALAASTSLQYALENKIDLADAEKTDWDGFGFSGRFLDHILNFIHTIPCHVVVIAHATVYEKRAKDQKTILSQTIQPISSTGPHGAKLIKHFSDVLYFQQLSGTAFYIDSQGSSDREGGSRLVAPKNYKFDELTLASILQACGSHPIARDAVPGWRYYKCDGELAAETNVASLASTGSGPQEKLVLPTKGGSVLLGKLKA